MIAAFKAFLKLAPDDPNAPIVKQQLKQLHSVANRVRLAAMTPIVSRSNRRRAGHRAGRARRRRAPRGRLRRDRRLHRGHGRQGERQGALHRRSAAAATRSPTPARPGRSARISTTPSPSRDETASARAPSCRSSGIRSPIRSRRRRPARPGMPAEHRHRPGRRSTSRRYVASVAGTGKAPAPATAPDADRASRSSQAPQETRPPARSVFTVELRRLPHARRRGDDRATSARTSTRQAERRPRHAACDERPGGDASVRRNAQRNPDRRRRRVRLQRRRQVASGRYGYLGAADDASAASATVASPTTCVTGTS